MSTQRRELEMEVRGRRLRGETSTEVKLASATAKVVVKPRQQQNKAIFRKVQVVYYLSRNGLLEHPHFMEVTHLAHQHLRLKDVMDRLTALRGKGMPSLYSWSCKRSYKNGYVWNDLSENDIIYPSEGAEYVLKGSELIEGCSEKFQKLQLGGELLVVPGTRFHHKRIPEAAKRRSEFEPEEEDDGEEEGEEEEVEDKTSYTTSSMNSRCSRGVSTEDAELEQEERAHKNNHSSPPSTTSSTVSDKANESNNASKRFEDGDPAAADSLTGRNSVLLQLFSCGGSTSFRGKSVPVPVVKPPLPCGAARKGTGASLQKAVVSKTAAGLEADMIRCMSENPRFGNLQAEEKEYFSGSIVDAMAEERAQLQTSGLKRSSSFNEERSSSRGQEDGEGGTKEEIAERKRETSGKMTGKCIPRKAATSKHTKK